MYKIILINGVEQTTIHYPSSENNPCKLFKGDLDEKESQISQLTIDLPFYNPGYNKLHSRATLMRVIRVKDNVTTFRGRLIDFQEHMDDNSNPFYKECIFEAELGYLCDTQVRPQTITDMTPYDLLSLLINNHNTHSDKQFLIGTVDMEDKVTTNLEYSTTLNSILTNLVNVQGGILQLRYGANDTRYIDYISSTGTTNNTSIALAKNMKSMVWEPDTTNIATRIIPVGKDNLNISSVNNNVDYLENTDAVSQYGIVEQVVKFDDIEDANVLKQKGQEKLTEMSKAEVKLSVEAYDLSTIGVDASSFYISDNVNVQNPVINFNDNFRVIEKTTDLLQPHNITLTFANKFERLSDKQVQMQRAANFVSQISDKNGVNTYFLRNAIDATRNMVIASGAYKNKKYIEDQGILFENTDETDASFGARHTWLAA
ncbi:phage tail protein [Clostridium felsineum]|uniref:phage tail protein n=1 Tax=Clostridium felsineum TaxID=36839 RepID=UPI00214DA1AE|nr:phage tail protein [Clostridium felsineum]MCR3759142.1 phage tail protein [Clostridium felsineum]